MESTAMPPTGIRPKAWAALHSIQWRLPLNFVAVALLTAAALSGLLLVTLNQYYARQERDYLSTASSTIIRQIETMYKDNLPVEQMDTVVNWLSFLSQIRIQFLSVDQQQVILDSGPVEEQTQLNVGFDEGVPPGEPGAADRPYLSLDAETTSEQPGDVPLPDNTPFDTAAANTQTGQSPRYPINIRRGSFGQLIAEGASPTERSNEQITMPIFDRSGNTLGYVVLSEGPAFGREIVGAVAQKGIVAAIVAVLIAVLAGAVISRGITQPVMALSEATNRMAQGDLTTRVPLQRHDEFGQLANAFNGMAQRIESTVNTLKQFVGDAAHEINTPLTALRTNLELTTIYDMPQQAQADIHQALAELTRLERLTRNLLVLARLEDSSATRTHSPVDITALARQMIERYASRAEQAAVEFESSVPDEPVMILGDREQLVRVFDNLIDNALKFTPADGRVHVGVSQAHDQVFLTVRDTGIGIPSADREGLFNRFHRGRNAAAFPGNGLGLVIAKAIVTDHGGQINVESGSGGTCFTVTLPDAAMQKASGHDHL